MKSQQQMISYIQINESAWAALKYITDFSWQHSIFKCCRSMDRAPKSAGPCAWAQWHMGEYGTGATITDLSRTRKLILCPNQRVKHSYCNPDNHLHHRRMTIVPSQESVDSLTLNQRNKDSFKIICIASTYSELGRFSCNEWPNSAIQRKNQLFFLTIFLLCIRSVMVTWGGLRRW